MKLKLVDQENTETDNEIQYPEHTMQYRGVNLYLRVEPVHCGFEVEYFSINQHEVPMFGKVEVRPVILHRHVHPRWFWKYIGKTPEKQLIKAVNSMKKYINKLKKSEETISRIRL